MKNKLRWLVDRYATLEALLSAGELLTLDVTNGKSIGRTATGESIRSDTVFRLLRAGLASIARNGREWSLYGFAGYSTDSMELEYLKNVLRVVNEITSVRSLRHVTA